MTTTPAPVAPQSGSKNFLTRHFNGATFLALEHVGHMALVVVVTGLVLSGVMAALSMWFSMPGIATTMLGNSASALMGGAAMKAAEGAMALGVVAALIVLVPALVVFDRRTRAEWHRRHGFAGRLAYKVPVYATLAVLTAVVVGFLIQMLYVVLASLAFIGVAGANIGGMYVSTFIPALIGFTLFSAACWYVFNLAKGHDNGRLFSLGLAALGAVTAVALFITAIVVLHETPKTTPRTPNSNLPFESNGNSNGNPYDESYYRDLLKEYYQ